MSKNEWNSVSPSGNVKISFLNERMARIRIFPAGTEFADSALNKYGFIQEPSEEVSITETHDAKDSATIVSSGKFSIRITEQGLVSAADQNGTPLFTMKDLAFKRESVTAKFQAQETEDWIGFGDQTRERLFHRGHKAVCWVCNVVSYLPVPFFMSTQGYGILLNTTHQVLFDMCATEKDVFSWYDERGVIDFYLFAAPTFKEIIKLYTELTGKPKLPPEWSFGLWYICRTQANDAEVMSDALNFRREGIPCDLIGLEPGWMEKNYDYSTAKSWNQQRFPLPDWQKNGQYTFIKALQRMGYHLELWLCQDYDLTFEEERRINGGKLPLLHEYQSVFHKGAEVDLHFASAGYMDRLTKRDEPWFDHLKKFVDWGADCFKQDGSSQVLTHPDRLYGNGMTDREMHNIYPLMYSRQMWEGFASYTNRRPVVFTVSGWTGFQSWCGTWTGDTGGRLETLGAMLNTSTMGHCWATNDMEVMQKEGIHFGYLQAWSQINSWTYFRMPWYQGEELLAMHKYYSRLRSRLIPYIYSWAYSATKSAVPLMIPLHIEFQNDIACRNVMHEYMLGRDLLVSIYKDEVCFPAGSSWKNFWKGEVIHGGVTKKVEIPADRGGGLFVREGALIPFGPVMQYRKERPVDEIDLYVYPSTQMTDFELYEDDGVTFDYLKGAFDLTKITQCRKPEGVVITIGNTPEGKCRKWSLTVALDAKPAAVENNGVEVPEELLSWDEARKELKVARVDAGEIVIR